MTFGFLISTLTYAQVTSFSSQNNQQESSEIEWKKMETDQFQIIFPKENYIQARKVGNNLEAIWQTNSHGLGVKAIKVPFILRRQNVISNGFVTFGPLRSEFFTTPPHTPELGSLMFLDALSIHEFRHINQGTKIAESSKTWYYFLGEFGYSLAFITKFPIWFSEGDAVYTETQFTNSGRGRTGSFFKGLKSYFQEGKDFDYDRIYLGSNKKFSPDHYRLGYLFMGFLYKNYGEFKVQTIINRAVSDRLNPFSMQNAIMAETGLTMDQLLQEAKEDILSFWNQAEKDLTFSSYKKIEVTNSKQVYTNYKFVQELEDGSYFAVRSGAGNISEFVQIKDGKAKHILYPRYTLNHRPHIYKNEIVWSDVSLSPRWALKSYSNLYHYNLKTKEKTQLSTNSRIFAPSLLNTKVVATQYTEAGTSQIITLDINSSNKISVKYAVVGGVLSYPVWIDADTIAFVERLKSAKTSVVLFSLKTKKKTYLIKEANENIAYLYTDNKKIFYQSDKYGVNDIFSIDLSGKAFRHTLSRYSADYPAVKNGVLTYSEYLAEGAIPVKTNMNTTSDTTNRLYSFVDHTVLTKKQNVLNKVIQKDYQVSDYTFSEDAINYHSWVGIPLVTSGLYSFSASSNNLLNTFSNTTGFSYYTTEQVTSIFSTISYAGLYPILDFTVDYANRFDAGASDSTSDDDFYEELSLEFGPRFSWSFLLPGANSVIQAEIKTGVIKQTGKEQLALGELQNSDYGTIRLSTLYTVSRSRSLLDVRSPLGFLFKADFKTGKSIDGLEQEGTLTAVDSQFYMPGMFDYNSLLLDLSYFHQDTLAYHYQGSQTFSRGYSSIIYGTMNKASLNYMLPLAYPEISWGDYVYFKKIKTNLFFDHTKYNSLLISDLDLNSAGVELLFNTTWFRKKLFNFDIGIRYVHTYLEEKDEAEFFIGSTIEL